MRSPDLCPDYLRECLPYTEFWSLVYLEARLPPLLNPPSFLLWISATHLCQQLALQLSSHSLSVNCLYHSKYIHWKSVPQSWRTAWVPYIYICNIPLFNESVSGFICAWELKIFLPNPFTHHFRIIFSLFLRLCSGSALAIFSPSLWSTLIFNP